MAIFVNMTKIVAETNTTPGGFGRKKQNILISSDVGRIRPNNSDVI